MKILPKFSPPSTILFSGMVAVVMCMDFTDEINIDRPFYYAIVKSNQKSGEKRIISLFSGIVAEPEI